MCKPASFVLTKDRVYWSMVTDSHEEIITEYGLHADGVRGPNVLRVEISPADGDMSSDPTEWVYRVDQDITPEWHDADADRQRAQSALSDWVAQRVFRDGSHLVNRGWYWAMGSAHVEARDSAHVVARDSAHVVARDSAHVEAWDSAHVEAWGSAHVEARGSAHVVAWGSAHVVAWDSAHVVARGSAHVVAWGSAHVEACDSAHVVARDSAHVEAWGSATVHTYSAGPAVDLHGGKAVWIDRSGTSAVCTTSGKTE